MKSNLTGKYKFVLALVLIGVSVLSSASGANSKDFEVKRAEPCSSEKCQLPHCRCSGFSALKQEFRGKEKEIPQLVTVTFDDAVNVLNYEQYEELFKGLFNPDHCPARGTFFVSHEYTDYAKVNALYSEGHEIALHSITHGTGTDYWRSADVDLLIREFGAQIEMLETYAKLNRKHIRGMRLPYLQIAGNNSFVAAKQLGLLYDSSMPTQQFKNPPMWPYTLDYLSVQDCQIGPCPDASIPGLWEYPMVSWTDLKGYSCSMIDGCIHLPKDDADAMFNWMLKNFNRHYETNRAPFGMFLHAAWFSRGKNYFEGFRKFLVHINSLPDVYITTPTRVIQYIKNPVLGKPTQVCSKRHRTNCTPRSCGLRKQGTEETRYMTVCNQCPEIYPWLDNPKGEL